MSSTANYLSPDGIRSMTIEQLRELYTSHFGVFPRKSDTHYNNREHYILLFEREVKFGRMTTNFKPE